MVVPPSLFFIYASIFGGAGLCDKAEKFHVATSKKRKSYAVRRYNGNAPYGLNVARVVDAL